MCVLLSFSYYEHFCLLAPSFPCGKFVRVSARHKMNRIVLFFQPISGLYLATTDNRSSNISGMSNTRETECCFSFLKSEMTHYECNKSDV